MTKDSKEDYLLLDRGPIEVKGKGVMNTYFLIGKGSDQIPQPEDSFTQLPLYKSRSSKVKDQKQQIKAIDSNGKNKTIKATNANSSTCLIS